MIRGLLRYTNGDKCIYKIVTSAIEDTINERLESSLKNFKGFEYNKYLIKSKFNADEFLREIGMNNESALKIKNNNKQSREDYENASYIKKYNYNKLLINNNFNAKEFLKSIDCIIEI